MRRFKIYIIACILAAIIPFMPGKSDVKEQSEAFPGWPEHFMGVPLTRLPLTEREEHFMQGFPGRIGRFTDGRREILLRWVTQATRKLHPASDCFKGAGYKVNPGSIRRDQNGTQWKYFEASKTATMQVFERISDTAGKSWTDVSAWYWAALFRESSGPWWAITIAEQQQ